MRSQREVDRDAPVAVLERDDHVTPQVAIRERAGEEDDGRPAAGRSPRQGPEPGVQPFAFHVHKTYSQYVLFGKPHLLAGLSSACLAPALGGPRRAPPPAPPGPR